MCKVSLELRTATDHKLHDPRSSTLDPTLSGVEQIGATALRQLSVRHGSRAEWTTGRARPVDGAVRASSRSCCL